MTDPAAASTAAPAKTEQPWEKNYPAGVKWDANIPVTTMVEMFKESVAKYGDRPCLNFFGRQWTYKQVDEMSDRFAKSLQDQGIGKGNHIGLCLPDLPFHVIAYYGAMKAGATVVNFNPLYAEKEMAELINDSKTDMMVTFNNKMLQAKLDKLTGTTAMKKTIVCDLSDVLPPKKKYGLVVLTAAKQAVTKLLPLVDKLPGDTKVQKDDHGKPIPLKGVAKFKKSLQDFAKIDLFKVVEDDKHVAFSSMMKSTGAVAPVDVKPDDVAVLQYTGGTTGIPKACMLTHANLTANIAQSEMWFSSKKDPNAPDKQEKMFAILPFFHVFAMTVQENLALKLGAELVMRPIPDIKKAVQVIDKYKPEMFAAVPSMYEAMLATKVPKVSTICKIFNKVAHPLTPVKKEYDLSSVKLWLTGGAPTPEPLEEAWKKRTGKAFTKGYGLSETSPLAIAIPLGEDIPGSIGLPVPGTEVRITSIENSPDISDKVMALGEVGEICLRGPQVMKGYHNRPDETAKVMDKDGYFHTGDTGYIDPKTGAIFITGRTKDMINRQGLKVFPLKVESKLLDHPAIKEVCVVGVPDPKVQEEVKAHIVFKEGMSATPAEIKAFLQDKLAPYEIPHLWKFRDDFPRTLKQQPDKKALKKEDLAELEAKAANANKPAAAPKVA